MDQDENGVLLGNRVKSSAVAYNLRIVYHFLEAEVTEFIVLDVQRSRGCHDVTICWIACTVNVVGYASEI
jgi:hypothetical protein